MFGINFTPSQKIILAANIALSILIIALAIVFFRDIPDIFSSLILISIILVTMPFIILKYLTYRKVKEIENYFPLFLADFVEAVRAGMTLPYALKHVSKNDYGELSKHIKKITAQIDWGIPLEKALLNFSKNSGSKIVGRIISTVIETHRFGGNLADIFEGISETSVEVERLREERKLYLQSQMTTGYIVFFVFIAVIIGLQRYLVPNLSSATLGTEVTAEQVKAVIQEYKAIFRNLIILQGLFAGLVVGKMSEGSALAGLKHSLFMMISGVIVFSIAT